MSFMTESLLLEAQTLRLDGDIDASINVLRTVLSQCNSDIDTAANEDAIKTTHQMRQMGAYQLAVLLLQRSGRYFYNSRANDDGIAIKRTELEHASEDEDQADELLWKLGYQLRLSTRAFGYPQCYCKYNKMTYPTELPLHIIDGAIPTVLFDALQFAFRTDSRYWTEFYSKMNVINESAWSRNSRNETAGNRDEDKNGGEHDAVRSTRNQFVSHNIRLSKSSISEDYGTSSIITDLQNANSLLEQVAIIAKHKLQDRFPKLKEAKSVEIWCHQRPPDGCHQLHYDMDEIRLWERRKRSLDTDHGAWYKRQKVSKSLDTGAVDSSTNTGSQETTDPHEQSKNDGIFCPMVSCVLTIHVPNNSDSCPTCGETAKGAPTVVCNQSIIDRRRTKANPQHAIENGVGWLCYPAPNRLLAFDGSLLHGVVPGIPGPGSHLPSSGDDVSTDSGYDTENSTRNKYSKRVTMMMGFWGDGVCTNSASNGAGESVSAGGPNMSFPTLSSCDPSHWGHEFVRVNLDESEKIESKTSIQPLAAVQVRPLWRSIKCNNDDLGEYVNGRVNDSIHFSGRFFLKSGSISEIDDEVISKKS